ncbi:a379f458-c16f-4cc4-8ab4-2e326f6e6af3 [Thermothielavioides terrestris]|uniref:NADPH-dependent FMN reductase-like domain-containing protein n=2 Tax=Thermothielavioides terrestris TaxID=2587410 RepID=G2REP7_THETT|nr:uncharacterized protein THITE_2121244 [Thermothielavioides terrestris NRRL 8126]AEO70180.1 hypothetical protein THITE_2121244 [Thermothielavioides terrestris NRRL 8126]SPQ17981.1 a379f458-c16f-4cc4-8ab4-2e326f6e6af3 [Thermothielavioides terrestris]
MSSPKTFSVGIISGSQRAMRVAPQVAAFVLEAIEAHRESLPPSATTASARAITFDHIDVGTLNLPLFDEPGLPAEIHSPAEYAHAHTREWAARVAALDAFIFVSPQYNWGIPAGLKNAIDYLYHEWRGKPAVIVTYGGHGGGKCAEQLRTVLGGGLRMRVVEPAVCLSFPSREVVGRATRGEDLELWSRRRQGQADGGANGLGLWSDRRGDIVEAWEALVKLLETKE